MPSPSVNSQVAGTPVSTNELGTWLDFQWWSSSAQSEYGGIAEYFGAGDGNLPGNRFVKASLYEAWEASDGLGALYKIPYSSDYGSQFGLTSNGSPNPGTNIILLGASDDQILWFEELLPKLPQELKRIIGETGVRWNDVWGDDAGPAPLIIEMQDWQGTRAGGTKGAYESDTFPWMHITIDKNLYYYTSGSSNPSQIEPISKTDFIGRLVHEMYHLKSVHAFTNPWNPNILNPDAVLGVTFDPTNYRQDAVYDAALTTMYSLEKAGLVSDVKEWEENITRGYKDTTTAKLAEKFLTLKFWVDKGMISAGPELDAALQDLSKKKIISGSGSNIADYSLKTTSKNALSMSGKSESTVLQKAEASYNHDVAYALNDVKQGRGARLSLAILEHLKKLGYIDSVDNPSLNATGTTADADYKNDGASSESSTLLEASDAASEEAQDNRR